MKHLPQTSLLILCLGLAGPAFAQQPIGPPQAAPGGAPACELMADAALTAARHEADSAFWLQVALLVNEPGGELQNGLRDAWRARREALETAEDQHAARLAVCAALGHGPYDPRLQPSDFSADVDCTYHPLPIGRTYVYERMTADGLERVETTVQDAVLDIRRVPCREVRTVETLNGALVEQTVEWYSQHADGTLWYFGENSVEFAQGLVISVEGSWRAGADGAKAGIQMPGAPLKGDFYRMEFLVNQAEDVARVIAVGQTVTVAAGTFDNCVAVEESSPLETADVAVKFYAPDVGLVLEVDGQTGERLELIEVK